MDRNPMLWVWSFWTHSIPYIIRPSTISQRHLSRAQSPDSRLHFGGLNHDWVESVKHFVTWWNMPFGAELFKEMQCGNGIHDPFPGWNNLPCASLRFKTRKSNEFWIGHLDFHSKLLGNRFPRASPLVRLHLSILLRWSQNRLGLPPQMLLPIPPYWSVPATWPSPPATWSCQVVRSVSDLPSGNLT